MDSEAEFDEFLMTVVESALTRPAGEREKYLKSACAGNVLMYQQAKERVEWEERMGEFLEEPLIRRTPAVEEPVEVAQTKRKTPKLPLFALASVLLMALAWFALRPHSTNTVRLAIVAQNVNLFAFVLDIKDRLRGMRSQFEVSEFEPGATHVLRIEFRDPIAKVTLKDLAADRELFRLEKQLSAAQLSDWVSSVSAAVGKEFGFKVEAGVSDLAYLNYWQGLECLHAGPQEKAISDFSKAMAHDPQAVQLSVAMGHAQLRMFQKGDGREWLDKAGFVSQQSEVSPIQLLPCLCCVRTLPDGVWKFRASGD